MASQVQGNTSLKVSTLFGKFLLAILSSWIVGPAGVIFLHFWGWGDNPKLIAVLLALSAGAPIQLLLNEFIAPSATTNTFFASKRQIAAIVMATMVAIWFALITSNKVHGEEPSLLAYPTLAFLAGASIWLSYHISLRFFRDVIHDKVSHQYAILIGATPGLTMLFIFASAALMQRPYVLLGAAILPAIAQLLILRTIAPKEDAPENKESHVNKPELGHVTILTMTALLIVIGICSTIVRDYIASWQQSYAAILLVSLNLMGTIVISLSRAVYLSSGQGFEKIAGMTTIGLTLIAATIFPFSKMAGALMAIFAMQFLIVTVLAAGRKSMSRQDYLKSQS